MNTCIALFRGINVVGSHTLSMKELKAVLEKNGRVDVHTHIQRGTAVFRFAIQTGSARRALPGVGATARNRRTVTKLQLLLG